MAATIAIAWLSHRLVEQPFLRLKDRMRSTPVAGLQQREGASPASDVSAGGREGEPATALVREP